MVVLNSNPEILLRKRKDIDRKRLEKQEQARLRQEEQKKKNKQRNKKFLRAETLVSNYKSNELERKRIKHITDFEKTNKDILHKKDDAEEKLLFVIRVTDHVKGLKIPSKANKVLQLLRLNKPNSGVFVKMTPTVAPLLNYISPFVVAGKPSLVSIRKLFQKRACISAIDEDTKAPKIVKLDNNAVVEEKFGDDLGLICIEDLIHEIATLGDNFKTVNYWLLPFKLNAPVSGWGPQSKLAKLQYAEEHKKKVSLAGNLKLEEIDIDQFIDEQN